MFDFRPTVVPNCNVNGSLRLGLRSVANKRLTAFCRTTVRFLNTLGRHPRMTVTCASCTVGFPRVSIRISTTGYGHTKVSPDTILSTINDCYNNTCVSGCGRCNGMCHIVVRTSPRCHLSRRTLGGVFMHGNARVTPIDRFIALGRILKPRATGHFGLCDAVATGIGPTSNCSSNRIRGIVRRITTRSLPTNCKCRCNNVTHRRTDDNNTRAIFVCTVYVFLVCLVLTYLCRDFLVPFTIVFSIPFKLVKSFLFTGVLKLRGGVCLRANIVVLVNLLTGATVLVARCTVRHHHGKVNVIRSTCSTTRIHLHPVLVAILAVVFNVLPLVFSSNTNTGNGDSLNANIINNVTIKALTLLFIIPIFCVVFRFLRRGVHGPVRRRPSIRILLRGRGDRIRHRHGWVGREVGGGVVALITVDLSLDNYNVCAGCRPTAIIPSSLCNKRIIARSATNLNGVS